MTIKLPTKQSQPGARLEWHPIDLGKHGSFEIQVERPTWAALVEDSERPRGYIEERLRDRIVSWRGVETDDGQPISYSWERFQEFCTAIPAVFQIASRIVSGLFVSLPEDAEKNSSDPSSDS